MMMSKNLHLFPDGTQSSSIFHRPPTSPNLSVSGLETPPRAESPTLPNTPKASVYIADLPLDGDGNNTNTNSPPASGSTTPTAADRKTQTLRTSFSGLAGFLRARYPSVIATKPLPSSALTSVVVPEVDAGTSDEARQEEQDDDDDRRTIRGLGGGDHEDVEGKTLLGNGAANQISSDGAREKWQGDAQSQIPEIAPTTPPIPILQHHVN